MLSANTGQLNNQAKSNCPKSRNIKTSRPHTMFAPCPWMSGTNIVGPAVLVWNRGTHRILCTVTTSGQTHKWATKYICSHKMAKCLQWAGTKTTI